jgi:hypothetical protein
MRRCPWRTNGRGEASSFRGFVILGLDGGDAAAVAVDLALLRLVVAVVQMQRGGGRCGGTALTEEEGYAL